MEWIHLKDTFFDRMNRILANTIKYPVNPVNPVYITDLNRIHSSDMGCLGVFQP